MVQSAATKERGAQLEQRNCRKEPTPPKVGRRRGRRLSGGASSPWGPPSHLLFGLLQEVMEKTTILMSLLEQSKIRPSEGLALCEENLRAISGCLHHYSVVCLALKVYKRKLCKYQRLLSLL